MKSPDLKKRIIEISYKHGLSHLGSCLTAVEIIEDIYRKKAVDEKFVLSAGHAGLALYVVLEKYEGFDAETLLRHSGIHPSRLPFSSGSRQPFSCSTGSLGMGLPVALGMALSDFSKDVYCLLSDGELAEGSVWESFLIKSKFKIENLKLFVNENGFSAYDDGWITMRQPEIKTIDTRHVYDEFKFLNGLEAHYHVLTRKEYKNALKEIEGATRKQATGNRQPTKPVTA